MFSGATIRQMSRDAAREASRKKRTPYVLFDADDEGADHFPFPNIGDYRPRGWDLVDQFMVDATGVGAEWEPALTIGQLRKRLCEDLASDKNYGYAIIEVGQCQIMLGVFEKVPARKSRAS